MKNMKIMKNTAKPANLKNAVRFFAGLCQLCLFAALAAAETPTVSEIIKKYEANTVFETSIIEAVITVKNKLGTTSDTFTSYGRKNGDTLIAITEGADRGQKILRLGNSIYLYYPDAEEVIRLQGSALKDSIMGSDYSYDDLTGDNSIEKNYNTELAGTENVDGFPCYRVIFTAKTRSQKYQKQEVWIDAATFASRKAIMYSASGKPIRLITTSEFMTVKGYTVPREAVTQNLLQKDSVTTMTIRSMQIDVPVSDKYFNRDELTW